MQHIGGLGHAADIDEFHEVLQTAQGLVNVITEERHVTASRIAARVHRIKPSPSSAASDRANELRRQGQSIINLVVGEPDFDTPAHIRHAANAAIERGETRYTQNAGTPQLRQAIVDKLARENGLAY
eukprot:gene517-biopygen360